MRQKKRKTTEKETRHQRCHDSLHCPSSSMYRPPGKDTTAFDQSNAAFIPKGAKNLPQTKFGILKLPKEGVFMVVT